MLAGKVLRIDTLSSVKRQEQEHDYDYEYEMNMVTIRWKTF